MVKFNHGIDNHTFSSSSNLSYIIWSFTRCPNPIWGLIIIDILFYFLACWVYHNWHSTKISQTPPITHIHTPHGPYASINAPHTHLIISPITSSLFYYSLRLLSRPPFTFPIITFIFSPTLQSLNRVKHPIVSNPQNSPKHKQKQNTTWPPMVLYQLHHQRKPTLNTSHVQKRESGKALALVDHGSSCSISTVFAYLQTLAMQSQG